MKTSLNKRAAVMEKLTYSTEWFTCLGRKKEPARRQKTISYSNWNMNPPSQIHLGSFSDLSNWLLVWLLQGTLRSKLLQGIYVMQHLLFIKILFSLQTENHKFECKINFRISIFLTFFVDADFHMRLLQPSLSVARAKIGVSEQICPDLGCRWRHVFNGG